MKLIDVIKRIANIARDILFTKCGNIFYVCVTHPGASDNNSGLDPNYPLVTVCQAYKNARAGHNDFIVIIPDC